MFITLQTQQSFYNMLLWLNVRNTKSSNSSLSSINNYKILFFCTLFHQQTFQSLGSLSFELLILVKKQEPEQASKCPGEYPKDRNNLYLNEATIVVHGALRVNIVKSQPTFRRKNQSILVYSTEFHTKSE